MLQALPDDVLLHIFTSLSAHALAAVKCTCTFFARHSPQVGAVSEAAHAAAAELSVQWSLALRVPPCRSPPCPCQRLVERGREWCVCKSLHTTSRGTDVRIPCALSSLQGHDSLPITEAAARLKIAAVWGPERVSRSWLVALRLTELPLRRPGGGADVEVGLECENLVQHPRPAGKPPSEDAPCSVCGLRGE